MCSAGDDCKLDDSDLIEEMRESYKQWHEIRADLQEKGYTVTENTYGVPLDWTVRVVKTVEY